MNFRKQIKTVKNENINNLLNCYDVRLEYQIKNRCSLEFHEHLDASSQSGGCNERWKRIQKFVDDCW